MWTQRTTLPYQGLPPGRNAQLTSDDIRAIQTHFEKEVEYMAPRLWVNSGEIVHQDKKGSFDVRGDCQLTPSK
jgi:putative ABC transport system permease protein